MGDGTTPAHPALGEAALREWQSIAEQVMRGIVHSLNNRSAALSAVLELSRDAGDDATGVVSILSTEIQRVAELSRLGRTLAVPRDVEEAIDVAHAAEEAALVLRFHAGLRERTVTIVASGAPPVRAAKWRLVRALVTLGCSAGEAVPDRGSASVVVTGEGDWLVARAANAPGAPSAYTVAMARAMGGDALERELGFRVPSLAAIRRREGR